MFNWLWIKKNAHWPPGRQESFVRNTITESSSYQLLTWGLQRFQLFWTVEILQLIVLEYFIRYLWLSLFPEHCTKNMKSSFYFLDSISLFPCGETWRWPGFPWRLENWQFYFTWKKRRGLEKYFLSHWFSRKFCLNVAWYILLTRLAYLISNFMHIGNL